MAKEIVALIENYHNGDVEARNKLIKKYSSKAEEIAKSYFGLGLENEDIIQLAYEGLIEGVDEILKDKKSNYTTYIVRQIEKRISCDLVDWQTFSYNDTSHRGVIVDVLKFKRDFKREMGREPTLEELKENLNVKSDLMIRGILQELDRRDCNIEGMNLDDERRVVDGVSNPEAELLYAYDIEHLLPSLFEKLETIPFTEEERKFLDCVKRGVVDIHELCSLLKKSTRNVYALKAIVALKLSHSSLRREPEVVFNGPVDRQAIEEEIRFTNRRKAERQHNRHRY